MIMRPGVLLLDKPTDGIQPNIIQQIGHVIRHLKQKGDTAIFMVEQSFDFAYGLADHIYAFSLGSVAVSGRKADLDRETLRGTRQTDLHPRLPIAAPAQPGAENAPLRAAIWIIPCRLQGPWPPGKAMFQDQRAALPIAFVQYRSVPCVAILKKKLEFYKSTASSGEVFGGENPDDACG